MTTLIKSYIMFHGVKPGVIKMTTREIIKELEKQKAMLGTGVFDIELLEKYLNLSAAEVEKLNIDVHGIGSTKQIVNRFQRLKPYKFTKPNFIRIKGEWSVLTTITHKTDLPVNIIVEKDYVKKHQKMPRFHKIDKAA